jgi:hypothetical protein
MEEQTSIEARLDKLQETILNASAREITQVKIEAGKKTITKLHPLIGRDLAALARQADRTAKQAILGVREDEDDPVAKALPDRVRWATEEEIQQEKRARKRAQPGGPADLKLADRPAAGPEDSAGWELDEAA